MKRNIPMFENQGNPVLKAIKKITTKNILTPTSKNNGIKFLDVGV